MVQNAITHSIHHSNIKHHSNSRRSNKPVPGGEFKPKPLVRKDNCKGRMFGMLKNPLNENVEVKVKMPRKLYELVQFIAKKFNDDLNEIIVHAIKDSINADIESGFAGYIESLTEEAKAMMKELED